MCDKPMGVFGGVALGSLFGLMTGRKSMTRTKIETETREPHRPWRHPAFVFLAVPMFTGIVLTSAAGAVWWLLAFTALPLVVAGGSLLVMRVLHRAVASPALTARLAGQPALPRAWARQPVPRWSATVTRQVPASQPAITGRVMAPGERIGS